LLENDLQSLKFFEVIFEFILLYINSVQVLFNSSLFLISLLLLF
jgi:hypothetical protein